MFNIWVKLKHIFQDHLYRNSAFLIMSRLLNAAAGFLFWVIAAKFYSIAEVGTATALISTLGIIMLFSRLGFDVSLIRFIANTDINKVFSTGFSITTVASAFISLLYILFLRFFDQTIGLNFISGIFFIIIAIFNSIFLITGNMFIALRKGQHFFIQTILISFRLFLLFPLAVFNSFGILLSLGLCYTLSVIFSLWMLRKEINFSFYRIDIPFLKQSIKYSVQSYISNILTETPILILPLMVLHLIGQEETAKYYIAMAVGSLTMIVPNSLNHSLFVEGSRGQPLKQNIKKTVICAFSYLIPLTIIFSIWGKYILGFISKEYLDAYNLLVLVVITSFFDVICLIYICVQNIKMRVEKNIRFNLIRFVLLTGFCYCFLQRFGIDGAGYAMLLTHASLVLYIAVEFLYCKCKKRT